MGKGGHDLIFFPKRTFLLRPFLAMIDRFLVDRAGLRSFSFSLFQSHPARFSTSPPSFAKKRMPPKKAPPPEKRTLLGRPGNNLKIGIVGLFTTFLSLSLPHIYPGLPNVGKSSFFNVLSETGPSHLDGSCQSTSLIRVFKISARPPIFLTPR